MDGVTAVVAPLREEIEAFVDRLDEVESLEPGPGDRRRWRGRLGGRPVIAAVTGDGPVVAPRSLRSLVGDHRPGRILVMGLAGGLSRGLEVASRVLARNVLHVDGRGWPCPEPDLDDLAGAAGARPGVAVTSTELATSVGSKARLWAMARRSEAGVETAVVDVESAPMVEVARDAGLPWLVLRAVSDPADEALPELLEECRDESGSIVRSSVMMRAFTRPGAIPRLRELQTRMKPCSEALAEAAGTLVLARWGSGVTSFTEESTTTASGGKA